MASHRKGLLPIKIGHTELQVVFRKKQTLMQFLPDLFIYLLKCGFTFK